MVVSVSSMLIPVIVTRIKHISLRNTPAIVLYVPYDKAYERVLSYNHNLKTEHFFLQGGGTMKTIVAVIGALCILIGIALAGCIDYSDEAPEETIQKDSDLDGWTDIQEREAHTNPFDVDTDHDGILDPEDPNPLYIGILTDPKQKLEAGECLEFDYLSILPPNVHYMGTEEHRNITFEDIRLPEGSTKPDCKYTVGGYSDAFWCNSNIYASPTKVMDFFIEKMLYDGWDITYCKWDSIGWTQKYGIMYFQKLEGEGQYVTITVIGSEREPEYSQFTIILVLPD